MFWIWRKPPDDLRERVVNDLRHDPGILWLSRYYPLPQLLLTGLLAVWGYVAGGVDLALSWVVWGIGVRTVVVYHVTWMINSVCHVWGYQHPTSTDGSRNVWWLSLFTFGENWHNNHHRDPNSAAHGWYWWQLDLNYWTIYLLSCLGLVWGIRTPKPGLK
jgi:stearoyl-CoA desaturase (delta-9 desaturase)